MLESLASLGYGFTIALQPQNLLYCFIGVTMGTLVGVLPGIGPTATIALLLPATFKLNPISAIIMLSGICYGAMYGGSTTSILLNIPGEASSVVTCLDGYQMARQGRAGPALGISAFGSFIAGTFSVLGLIVLAPTLADFALKFGPPEYFALMIMGLTVVAYLARKSMIKALMMTVLGIILGCVGLDPITATPRFTFGILELTDGPGDLPSVTHDVDPPLEIGEVRMQVVLGVLEERPNVRRVPLAPEIHPESAVGAPQVLEDVATVDTQREAHGRKRRIQLGLPIAASQTAEEAGDGCDRAAPVRLGPAHG